MIGGVWSIHSLIVKHYWWLLRAGPAKKWTTLLEALAPTLLRVRTWELDALTLTPHFICRKKSMRKILISFSDSITPRYPRKLKNPNFSTLNSYKNRRSRSMWNFGGYNAEGTRRTSLQVSLPSSLPIKRYYQNSIPYTTQMISTKNWKKWNFCDAPLNFENFDLKV